MTAHLPRRNALARGLAGVFLAAISPSLAGCGSSSQEPSASGSEPASEATAPPFAVKLDAPDSAGVGDTVTVTLTNVGRLPDAYQLTPEPVGGAQIPQPDVKASPGESVEVAVRIRQTPVSIVVESVGGGGGQQIGQVTIN